jgi:hypothetical protein
MSRMVVLFQSTHDAIRAERLCHKHNLECRTIAVPRTISSDCGIALEIKEVLINTVADTLSKNDIHFSWHRLPD